MATTVYTTEEVELQDGQVLTLRPLNIKNLRKFHAIIAKLETAVDELEGLSITLDAAAVCVRDQGDFWNSEEDTHTELMEEVFDVPTMYKVIEVCGGIKMNDPKLLEMAQALVMEQQAAEGGKTST